MTIVFSLAATGSSGYKEGSVPYNQYKWTDNPLWVLLSGGGKKVGIKRVETKRFIRFEHFRVIKWKENGYWYSRTSYWFIRFPYCKNDKEILIANIIVWIIVFPFLLKILSALVGLVVGLVP